jgi:6-pyruvoyltetrahydropterin/6-carboxytetrahydropterin synthase
LSFARAGLWPAFCVPAAAAASSGRLEQRHARMARCAVTRRVHFNAAHRLHNPNRADDWNQTTFGVCNNPNFHGHNYELDVTVEGDIDVESGYVMDLHVLKLLVEDKLLSRLDHRNLNVDVPWFSHLIPTAENIVMVCWRELKPSLPDGLALRLRLWETPRNYVEYDGA